MYRLIPAMMGGLSLAFAFCTSDPATVSGPVTPGNADTSLPAVETKNPNTDYKPAFAGQTRIAGVKTTTPYKTDKLA